MSTVDQFLQLLQTHGSDAIFHREGGTVECPCLTPEGYRDPEWHLLNPAEPMCNADGLIPSVTEYTIKAFIQPAQSTRATRLSEEFMRQLFGTVRADDHFGILPITWGTNTLDVSDWGQNGTDWIGYDTQKYFIVNVNKIPDPSDGNPNHHYECGLRLLDG